MPSKIEWTQETWNPISGCSKCSPGCENCYAERMSKRLAGRFGYPGKDPFRVTFHPDKLDEPLHWKKPRTVFVCSMGDLFHEDVSANWIDAVMSVILKARQHTFQILTKRPQHMFDYFYGDNITDYVSGESKQHIWLGVTVCNQDETWKIDKLLQIPAAVHFVSVEPMLSPVKLFGFGSPTWGKLPPSAFLNWVICGAETGPGKRSMDLNWARSLCDQCQDANVPFFFKKDSDGNRELDGQLWEQMP